ncbi:unnamed protein product [Periconia digitata]|uniref:N-acetyltransferase domain-containing protein n=1 Tax=Periconia digitata TaxID=1303443 RepID=A0A9W4U3X1_9PLEO|nr:unnamed protein product [Periconia digitata]
MSSTFHIRPASLAAKDDERMLSHFDSQLKWLESIGSGGQWGPNPRSNNEAFQEKIRGKIQLSETCMEKPFSSKWARAYISEAEVDADSLSEELKQLSGPPLENGRVRVPVASMILDSKSADYVRDVLPEEDKNDPFIYLLALFSDRKTSSIGKGAGAALIKHAKDEAKRLGIHRIDGDCYAGNDGKLLKYYESQGFKSAGEFGSEQGWPGVVFEMRF